MGKNHVHKRFQKKIVRQVLRIILLQRIVKEVLCHSGKYIFKDFQHTVKLPGIRKPTSCCEKNSQIRFVCVLKTQAKYFETT
jgi:hypothetical protein